MAARKLTKGSLVVTTSWDDGTMTDLRLAELMEKYGIKGTFYVAKSFLNNPLPKEDIVALGKRFEIGAHTVSHADLIKVSLPEAEREIKDSKTYLEDLMGHSISMFCYPYGRYNDAIKRVVKNSGFIAARTCDPGTFNLPEDPYQWHITFSASNASPLMALKIWLRFRLWKISALTDWESRAKLLFDLALHEGGVYHIYGHSVEFGRNNEWDKLERVFTYISRREGVLYMANGEIFSECGYRVEA